MGAAPGARGGVLSALRPKRPWRLLGGLGVVLLSVVLLLAVGVVGLAIWARTEGGRDYLRGWLERLLAPVHGTLSIGALETDLYSWAVFHDITLADEAGTRVGHVETLSVRYLLGGLVGRRLVVPEARIDGLDLTLTETPTGLDIAAMWDDGSPPSGEPWGGIGIQLVISALRVEDGTVRYRREGELYVMEDAQLLGAVELLGSAVGVKGLSLGAPDVQLVRGETTATLGALSLAGDGRWDPHTFWIKGLAVALGPNHAALEGGFGRLDGEATVGVGVRELHVELDTLVPITGPLPVIGTFDATGGVAGLLAAPQVLMEIQTPGGPLTATGSIDTREPVPTWAAAVALRDVVLDRFLPDVPAPTQVRGTLSMTGTGVRWPDGIEAEGTVDLHAAQFGALSAVALAGHARLADGVIEVDGLDTSLPGASAAGTATIRLETNSGSATLRRAQVELWLLRRFGVTDARGNVGLSGTATFGWGDTPKVDVNAQVHGRAVGWADIGATASADGPVTVSWTPGAGLDVDVDLALGAVDGLLDADSGSVDALVHIAEDGAVAITGEATLTGLAGAGVTGRSAHAVSDLRRAANGRLDGTLGLDTADLEWEGWRSDVGELRARFEKGSARVTADLRNGARTMVGFDGEIDLGKQSIRARRLEIAPTDELAWRSDGVATARLVEGGVEDVNVRLVSGQSVFELTGGGRRGGMVDISAAGRDVQLDNLAKMLPSKLAGYAGRVTLRASLEGPSAHPELYVDLAADDLAIPELVRRLDVTMQGVGADHRLHIEGELGTDGRRLARIDGELPFSLSVDAPGPLTDGLLDLRLLLPPTDAELWNQVLVGAPLEVFRASGEVQLTGPVLDPLLRVVVAAELPIGPRGAWLKFDLDADTKDGLVQTRLVARERLERRAMVDGTIELKLGDVVRGLYGVAPMPPLGDVSTWLGALELDVVPMRLPIQSLAVFIEDFPRTLSGDLSGGLHVTGAARAPKVEGALLLVQGQLGDLPLSPALVALTGAAGGYRIDANLGFGTTGSVVVGGFLPFDPSLGTDLRAELSRPGLDLDVRADGIPLQAVAAAWPSMRAYGGAFTATGRVGGSLLDPEPDVRFGLTDGDFALTLTGVRYREARFSGRLTRDDLQVEDLSTFTVRDGVRVGAQAEREGRVYGSLLARRVDNNPVLDGGLNLDRALLLDLPDRGLRVDGAARLRDLDGRVALVGNVRVVEANFTVGERFFAGMSDLALPPDLRVFRGGSVGDQGGDETPKPPMFPTWLEAEVEVDLQRNAFLDATLPMQERLARVASALSSIQVTAQLDGQVTAEIHDGDLSLVGEVTPVRGRARVLSVPFDLRGGTIAFTGKEWLNPLLNLTAVHPTVDYGDISAHIGGSPSSLTVSFSAEDSGLANEDILSVLILGHPASEIGAGEGDALASLAGAFVTATIQQEVTTTGARAFDLFEFDATGNLRIGRRFGEKTFLLGRYDLNAEDDENEFEVTLELRLDRYWQLELTTGTSAISSFGLTRKWRF